MKRHDVAAAAATAAAGDQQRPMDELQKST
jgi:hypothetical protein